jgi:manganese/zinc/iron transport system permease protein
MLVWAAAVGILSAVLGYAIDSLCPTSLAGMMTVVAGGLFVAALLFSPRHGVLSQVVRNARLRWRIVGEDLLAYLYRKEEEAGQEVAISVLEARQAEGGIASWLTLPVLRWWGQVRLLAGGQIALTEKGRELGRSLVRAHRLWEAYLEENLELPRDHLHEPATRMEHYLGPDFQSELAAQLRQSAVDPHGRDIPPNK